MLRKIILQLLVILNFLGGFFLLGTIELLEHFEPISTLRIIVCIAIMGFYLLELAIVKEI